MSVAAHVLASSMAMTVAVTAARAPVAAIHTIASAELLTPVAIAVAGDRLYVANFDRDRIVVLTLAGEPVKTWGWTGRGRRVYHTASIDNTRHVYVHITSLQILRIARRQ